MSMQDILSQRCVRISDCLCSGMQLLDHNQSISVVSVICSADMHLLEANVLIQTYGCGVVAVDLQDCLLCPTGYSFPEQVLYQLQRKALAAMSGINRQVKYLQFVLYDPHQNTSHHCFTYCSDKESAVLLLQLSLRQTHSEHAAP